MCRLFVTFYEKCFLWLVRRDYLPKLEVVLDDESKNIYPKLILPSRLYKRYCHLLIKSWYRSFHPTILFLLSGAFSYNMYINNSWWDVEKGENTAVEWIQLSSISWVSGPSLGMHHVSPLSIAWGPFDGCGQYVGKGLEVLALVLLGVLSFLHHLEQSNMEIPSHNACCESLRMDKEKIIGMVDIFCEFSNVLISTNNSIFNTS